jgi:pilus assembly protein FimV
VSGTRDAGAPPPTAGGGGGASAASGGPGAGATGNELAGGVGATSGDSVGGAGAAVGGASAASAEAGGAVAAPDPEVAEVLQRLRSGVRQRLAEAATMGGGLAAGGGTATAGLAQGLLAVKSHEYVQEPVALSHRPRLGKLVVFARKAFFHLFLKWFIRPVVAQQNAFNQAAARLLQELAEAEERTAREARLLAARLAALEARFETGAGDAALPAAAPGTRAASPSAAPATPGARAAGEPPA